MIDIVWRRSADGIERVSYRAIKWANMRAEMGAAATRASPISPRPTAFLSAAGAPHAPPGPPSHPRSISAHPPFIPGTNAPN